MSLEDVFLRDVLDRPDDDTPRLVYADWLEDNGDEQGRARAELIRVQCEVERLPPGDRRRTRLERQARAVLKKHAREWTKPLRRARLGRAWEFRRGFVEGVTMSAAREFVPRGAKLFELAPIRSACFYQASNEVDALADCPHLARLRSVDLRDMCSCGSCPILAELRHLFASPHVANLTRLVLAGNRIDPDTAARLAASPYLSRLGTLDLSRNALGDAGVRALAEAPHLKGLTSLGLSSSGVGAVGAEALARSPLLARLTALELADNRIGDAGARVLAASRNVAGLTALDLRNNEIGAAGARALAKSTHLADQVQLRLDGNDVDGEAAAALRARFGKRVKL
jgi:uncharacterized protein (TIGR02996 family)